MSGKKEFVNNSSNPLSVTLFIRQGDQPGNEAGTVVFQIQAGQTISQTYGSDTDSIYLDGIVLEVVDRGSSLDNLLNTNSIINFAASGSNFTISGNN